MFAEASRKSPPVDAADTSRCMPQIVPDMNQSGLAVLAQCGQIFRVCNHFHQYCGLYFPFEISAG